FPLEVRQMLRKYPETGQRRIKWFALDKAAGKLEAEAAAREAYEEAGVRGEVSDRSLGFFPYLKNFGQGRRALCLVRVFPLEVRQMLRKYPETGQRRIKWFALDKAAGKLDEPDLAAMVREFDPDGHAAAPAEPMSEPTA
ncbi:hypothetical protein CNY89_19400, partial [Amaricoccus sp. HAR-UPW-R2A-40]